MPQGGIEPPAYSLPMNYSTPELLRLIYSFNILLILLKFNRLIFYKVKKDFYVGAFKFVTKFLKNRIIGINKCFLIKRR